MKGGDGEENGSNSNGIGETLAASLRKGEEEGEEKSDSCNYIYRGNCPAGTEREVDLSARDDMEILSI